MSSESRQVITVNIVVDIKVALESPCQGQDNWANNDNVNTKDELKALYILHCVRKDNIKRNHSYNFKTKIG